MDSLINDFSELSITNNNNFNDEINEFMNIDINHPEKYRYPHAIIYGFKLIGDVENNFFYIGSSINFYFRLNLHFYILLLVLTLMNLIMDHNILYIGFLFHVIHIHLHI